MRMKTKPKPGDVYIEGVNLALYLDDGHHQVIGRESKYDNYYGVALDMNPAAHKIVPTPVLNIFDILREHMNEIHSLRDSLTD